MHASSMRRTETMEGQAMTKTSHEAYATRLSPKSFQISAINSRLFSFELSCL